LDNKDPTIRGIAVDSGRVGLPSKEYYTKSAVLANYTQTMVQMFESMRIGKRTTQNLTKIATDVIKLEAKIKGAAADPAKARDVTVSTSSSISSPDTNSHGFAASITTIQHQRPRLMLLSPKYQ
jgi:predicted metalloendopeptidase